MDTQIPSQKKTNNYITNQLAEILYTTDVFTVETSGINNQEDIGTTAINTEERKRKEWFTGPAWLKQIESAWPEPVNLNFSSDEESIY